MKVERLLVIIILTGMCPEPCFGTDHTDETPALRGVIERGANQSSRTKDEASVKNSSYEDTNVNEVSQIITIDESNQNAESESSSSPIHSKKALKGGVIQTEVKESQDSLSIQAQREIAAIGISWNLFTRVINYVDPGSDLFGKIEVRKDKFVGLGKLDAVEVVRTVYSIGDSDTWVDAVIRGTDHMVRHIPVRRRPISDFAPKFARSFARQYKLHH